MVRSGLFFSWPLRLGALVGLVTCVCCGGSSGQGPANNASPQAVPPLSANDVSWLFPGPTRAEDFAKLIAVRDLTRPNRRIPPNAIPFGPMPCFNNFSKSRKPRGASRGHPDRIGLPAEAQIDRRLVHRRHPHRCRRARPLERYSRAIRTVAGDSTDYPAGDAKRRMALPKCTTSQGI